MKDGKGKFYYQNGEVYDGYYKLDKRDGFGEYFYMNGDVYKGYWS